MPGDGYTGEHRDIVFCMRDGGVRRINELNPAYMPLHFPLLFSRGELGWQVGIPHGQYQSQHTGNSSFSVAQAYRPT